MRPDSPASRARQTSQPQVHSISDWMFLQPGIIDLLHEAVITTDLQGTITGCNRASEQVFGYSPEQLIGQNVSMLYADDGEFLAQERLRPSMREKGCFRGTVRHRTSSGRLVLVDLSIHLLRDEEDTPTGTIAFAVVQKTAPPDDALPETTPTPYRSFDELYSNSYRALPATSVTASPLERREELSRLGLSIAKVAVTEVDLVQGVHHLSAEAARIFGLGQEAMTVPREAVRRRVHPDDIPGLLKRNAAAFNPQGTGWFDWSYRYVWPNGDVRWVRVRKQVFFEGEDKSRRPLRAIATVYDVTDTARADAEYHESEQRFRNLAGGVAHDFNNLLTVILGQTSMMAAAAQHAGDQEHLKAILKAAATAGEITKQLLTLSGKHVLASRVFNVNECVSRMADLSKPVVGQNIQVETRLDPDTGNVKMNAAQFDQIILNLIVNARDAMPAGGVVTISTERVEKYVPVDGSVTFRPLVKITVTDTGQGIAQDVQKRLFTPYFTTKPVGKGSGLGLAIVQAIVEDASGSISVKSSPGMGAAFEILLPAVEPEMREAPPEEPGTAVETVRTRAILIAEDDDAIREMLKAFLTAKNFHVIAARCGDEAISQAEAYAEKIDLLISDVRMSAMDGPTLSRKLTGLRPGMKTILISGYMGDSVANMDDPANNWIFLQKPFSLDGLLKLVERAISDNSGQRKAFDQRLLPPAPRAE